MAPPALIVAISTAEGRGVAGSRGRRDDVLPATLPPCRPATLVRLRSRRNRLRQANCRADQIRLRQRRAPQLAGDRTLVHDQRPVTETDDLGEIGREKEDSVPLA